MKVCADSEGLRRWHDAVKGQAPPADVQIVTSDGHRIAAHSSVLAAASPVLENLVYERRKSRGSERVVSMLGVPSDVVFAFLHFIYSSRTVVPLAEGREAMEKHGVQLLVLAHKFRVGWLKRACEVEVARQLKPKSAIDVLQIARLCDASRLYQSCLGLVSKDFDSVLKSDGWRFLERHDLRLQLEIMRFLEATDQRRKRWRRERSQQEMYEQLSEAMDCLEHICAEGCTHVGPHDRMAPRKHEGPCTMFRTCEGLQFLIRHFATCSARKAPNSGLACPHCKRMRRLFRLHSSLCDRGGESCKVPLCMQFKLRVQMNEKGDDATWRLLVKKVAVARAMCTLARRKKPEELHDLNKLEARSHRRIR